MIFRYRLFTQVYGAAPPEFTYSPPILIVKLLIDFGLHALSSLFPFLFTPISGDILPCYSPLLRNRCFVPIVPNAESTAKVKYVFANVRACIQSRATPTLLCALSFALTYLLVCFHRVCAMALIHSSASAGYFRVFSIRCVLFGVVFACLFAREFHSGKVRLNIGVPFGFFFSILGLYDLIIQREHSR